MSGAVIGAGVAVHRVLGPGFLESVYQRAMAVELQQLGLEFATQVPVSVTYRGVLVGEHRLDLLVAGSLVVELKATTDIHRAHRAQLRSYLTATGCRAGLILNFGQETLQIRRTG